jgi:hypothetical protein
MTRANPALLIVTSINGLNFSIQKNRVTECIKNINSTMYYLQEIHFGFKNLRKKIKGWEKIFYAMTVKKKEECV